MKACIQSQAVALQQTTDRLPEPDPSVAVWSELEAGELLVRRVVIAVGEDLAHVLTLFGLNPQFDLTRARPEVRECEHGAARSVVDEGEYRSFAGVDVVTLARAKLGTLAKRVERSAKPRQQRVWLALLIFDIDGP